MKLSIGIIFLLLSFTVIGQDNFNFELSRREIVVDLIRKMPSVIDSSLSYTDSKITGLIDTRFKQVEFINDFSYTGMKFSRNEKSSFLIESIKIDLPDALLYEFDSIQVMRNELIKSSFFVQRDTCNSSCTKIYFELKNPIEGWESLIINSILVDPSIKHDKKYFFNKLTIPVQVFAIRKEELLKKEVLFIYNLPLEKKNLPELHKILVLE